MRRHDPDALTEREREVLALIRRGLTNEEIAQRLGITLDGAKYHVSQILSKLGVATREEAAATPVAEAFEPRRERWWTRWPLWAKIAGAATVAAALAGLVVLAWGVVRTESDAVTTEGSSGELQLQGDRSGQVIDYFLVEGAGMDPTLPDGTLVEVLDLAATELERGDIVVYGFPNNPDRRSIKRIVGVPGDEVEIREPAGELVVNGETLTEPYARGPTVCVYECTATVPEAGSEESLNACSATSCYYVLGDNRPNSSDSRYGRLVPGDTIVGRVAAAPLGQDYKISWDLALELIRGCRIEQANTSHSGRAGIVLKGGTDLLEIIEPDWRQLWPEVAAASQACGYPIGFGQE
jgi:signal peptidase I